MKIKIHYILCGKLWLTVLMLLSLHNSTIFSQKADYYLDYKQYSFIKYDSNRIDLPYNNSDFKTIYKLVDTIIAKGEGKLRIIHIGGSHIQADIYTHLIRKRLQGMSPDMNGGRGLIFPYRIAKTNGPSNFRVTYNGDWLYCKNTQGKKICNLGITGYSVTTTDSIAQVAIDINRDTTIYYSFNSVRVFHDSTSYKLTIKINEVEFTGSYNDSLGFTKFNMDSYYDSFQLLIQKDSIDDSFNLQGISFDNDGPGVVYNTVGVNGAMLKSFLRCSLYEKHLKALSPELVIFSIGTNDAYTRNFDKERFRREYRLLIDKTLYALPDAQIIITVPNDSYLFKRYVNLNTVKMRDIIYKLSEEYNCGVWDFYTIMGGLNSVQDWYSLKMMKYDKIHFNRKGYLLKGDLFFSAFLKGWEGQLMNINSESATNE